MPTDHYDAKYKVKLGGFQSQLEASYESSHTEEIWYNDTVCSMCVTWRYNCLLIIIFAIY